MLVDFVPRAEKVKKQAFRAHDKDIKDAWYLAIVATDPDHEGRGLSAAFIIDCSLSCRMRVRLHLHDGQRTVQNYRLSSYSPGG